MTAETSLPIESQNFWKKNGFIQSGPARLMRMHLLKSIINFVAGVKATK